MENEVDHHADDAEKSLAFSVDTHLLRELGSLLVGRDSTAVVELVKNAYDADATRVVLHGEALTQHGTIIVSDDGHGMTLADFTDKFLRIAGRSKEGGQRRSPMLRRRYTGAKGIGRLSAHKLGEAMALESMPALDVYDRGEAETGFTARINWRAIEESTASIEQTREISVQPHERQAGAGDQHGTTLTIHSLFSPWQGAQLTSFLAEVRSTRPDPVTIDEPPVTVFPGESLLGRLTVADSSAEDPGFRIELSGDFAGTESQWPNLLALNGTLLMGPAHCRDPPCRGHRRHSRPIRAGVDEPAGGGQPIRADGRRAEGAPRRGGDHTCVR
ncbi:ATP-binding protein [Microbacterium sufflavum]|uniref:ATP-binding protein n=1 Tax=Microbacterium sufflavum TaxID=2851649 RepID=UPI003898E2AA